MEVIFPDWSGPHPDVPDPRPTILLPFPRPLPELAPGQRIVLDSGAFGRVFAGARRQDTLSWMLALRDWYRAARQKYGDAIRWMVAPDTFGDQRATHLQYEQWQDIAPDLPVAPVIQQVLHRAVDLFVIQKQARDYGAQRVICLANCLRLSAAEWGSTLNDACALIRRHAGPDCHIHLLGAGWSLVDIALYRRNQHLNSIDAISYYLAAQRGERWCKCCTSDTPWPTVALHHAQTITRQGEDFSTFA